MVANESKLHETQPASPVVLPDEPWLDSNREIIQRVEGGGPLRKTPFSALPGWLRVFGYFFIAAMLGMIAFGMFQTLLR